MDARHARQHLNVLHSAAVWLRSSAPEHPRYRLWLGDLIEFTRAAFGLESAEMAEVRAVITADPKLPADAPDSARVQAHLARLDRFIALIDRFARRFPEDLPMLSAEGEDRRRNGTLGNEDGRNGR